MNRSRSQKLKAVGRLAAVMLLPGLGALAGCGASALSAVRSAIARTEAAGSARFVLSTSAGGPVTTAKGSVNFTDGELAMTVYGYGPSGKGMVSMEVREIGDMEYSFVPFAPLDAAGWVARRVPRTLDELQFPLYALSARDKVSVEGHAKLQGVATTAYVIHMPGGTSDGVHVAPYPLLLYLDAKGRIRQAGQVASETGIKGHSGPLNFYSSVEFTDFGAPVHVQVPKANGTT
jgi:hypothetical protein